MGGEFGQWDEWSESRSLDWHLLAWPPHQGLLRWVRDLNTAYRAEPALHERDCRPDGFEWSDASDSQQSIVCFVRKSENEQVLAVFNFTPVPRHDYRVGVSLDGWWEEILNSDAPIYGGSGHGNFGGVLAMLHGSHGRPFQLSLSLPPLGVVMLRRK